jgi:hypothetical protein
MNARRWLILGAAFLASMSGAPAPVAAQTIYMQTVSACGTPNNTPVVGQPYPATMDTTGKSCTSAVGAGGTSSNFGSAFPSAGTAIGVKNGANMVNLTADASGNLDVNCSVGCSGGTFNNNADAVATSAVNGQSASWLYGFNGTTWDRIRDDTHFFLSMNLGDVGGSAIALGQTTMSASIPVAIASNQGGVPVTMASGAVASGAVASGAYASGSIADGAQVTLGTKADAATCATTNTQMACDRQIDADIKAAPTLGSGSAGMTPVLLNALSTTVKSVVSSAAHQLFLLQCGNTNASEGYVQIFDVATAGGVTLGTTTPKLSVPISATASGGFAFSLVGIQFANGIQTAATTTATGSTALGTALDCNAVYN